MEDKKLTMTEIDELITMTKRFTEIYQTYGLCGISTNQIHLTDEAFNDLFADKKSEIAIRPFSSDIGGKYMTEKSIMVGDIEIMCLT